MNHFKKTQRGFTLTEAAIVLGIVGLVFGAIWSAATAARNKLMINKAAGHYLTIAENIRSSNGRPYFSAASVAMAPAAVTTAMINAGAIPPELVNAAGNAATSAWGGALQIDIVDTNTFSIQFGSVPQSACSSLLAMIGNGDPSGARAVIVGTGALEDIDEPLDLTSATSATLCGNPGLQPTYPITFHFTLT